MFRFALTRIAMALPTLLIVAVSVFVLIRLIPGDATLLAIGVDTRITPEQRELVRKSYGLDQPAPVQYLRWLEHVAQGDLGTSLRTRRSVNEELRLRLQRPPAPVSPPASRSDASRRPYRRSSSSSRRPR